MSVTVRLTEHQSTIAGLELEVDTIALRLRSMSAHLHAVRAVGLLHAAVRELGAAILHEQLRDTGAPSNDVPLMVEVISPGADRADELIRTIPASLLSMSERTAALRLGAPHDAIGARLVAAVLRRNGWRQGDSGRWYRPGYGAAADVAPEQPR